MFASTRLILSCRGLSRTAPQRNTGAIYDMLRTQVLREMDKEELAFLAVTCADPGLRQGCHRMQPRHEHRAFTRNARCCWWISTSGKADGRKLSRDREHAA